jgi:molybdate transport system regulatory protein
MNIGFQFWIENNGEIAFDQRLKELLKAADELKSLAAATRKYNMSYRQAWGKLRDAENRLGFKLLECSERGRGLVLTPDAQWLLDQYAALHRNIKPLFQKESNRVFAAANESGTSETREPAVSSRKLQRRVAVARSSKNRTLQARELRSYAVAAANR